MDISSADLERAGCLFMDEILTRTPALTDIPLLRRYLTAALPVLPEAPATKTCMQHSRNFKTPESIFIAACGDPEADTTPSRWVCVALT